MATIDDLVLFCGAAPKTSKVVYVGRLSVARRQQIGSCSVVSTAAAAAAAVVVVAVVDDNANCE